MIAPSQPKDPEYKETTVKAKDTKYSIPQVLGGNKYKDVITRADDFFKTKRYQEAKEKYEEALKIKPEDPYAIGRLAEIEKKLAEK